MRKIENLGGLVGQDQSQGDQGIDGANGNAIQRQLNQLGATFAHWITRCCIKILRSMLAKKRFIQQTKNHRLDG
jgi:hypothetical protein